MYFRTILIAVGLLALICSPAMAERLSDSNGTLWGWDHIENKGRTVASPYLYSIAEGDVPGHTLVDAFGERESVAVVTTGADVWTGTANEIPIPDVGGVQMVVNSTSADDAAAGTGMQQVHIHYLDSDGNEQEENVILNGVTGVNTAFSNGTFINDFHALTVGTGGAAAGDVKIYKSGAASTIYNQIDTGSNMSASTMRKVPTGKTWYIVNFYATATAQKPVAIRLRTYSHHGTLYDGVFLFQRTMFLEDTALDLPLLAPIKVPAGAVIKVSAWATQSGANISAGWEAWQE